MNIKEACRSWRERNTQKSGRQGRVLQSVVQICLHCTFLKYNGRVLVISTARIPNCYRIALGAMQVVFTMITIALRHRHRSE